MLNKQFFPSIQTKEILLKQNNIFFGGLTILHISDLHICKKTSKQDIELLIETLNQQEFDMIVCTGDLIDDKIALIEDKIRLFQKVRSKIYFVSGNHDLTFGYKRLIQILDEIGFIILDNKHQIIQINNIRFNIIGLSDRFSRLFGIKRDIKTLLDKLDNTLPTIFLAHQPPDHKYALQANATLMLCGHTHGGQIFPFHLLVKLSQKYLSGLYYNKKLAIYVNSGIGTWGIHKRFLSKAEIPILKLI